MSRGWQGEQKPRSREQDGEAGGRAAGLLLPQAGGPAEPLHGCARASGPLWAVVGLTCLRRCRQDGEGGGEGRAEPWVGGLPPAREANPEHPRAPRGLAGEGAEPPRGGSPWGGGLVPGSSEVFTADQGFRFCSACDCVYKCGWKEPAGSGLGSGLSWVNSQLPGGERRTRPPPGAQAQLESLGWQEAFRSVPDPAPRAATRSDGATEAGRSPLVTPLGGSAPGGSEEEAWTRSRCRSRALTGTPLRPFSAGV